MQAGARVWQGVIWARQYPVVPFAILLIVLVIPAIFAPQVARYDPLKPVEGGIAQRLQPPVWQENGSWDYPLGTDKLAEIC